MRRNNLLPRAAQGRRHRVGWWPPCCSEPQGGTSVKSAVKLICWNTKIWLCSSTESLCSNSEVTTYVLINNLEIPCLHDGSETLMVFQFKKSSVSKICVGREQQQQKNAFSGCFCVCSFQQEQFFCSVKCSGNRNLQCKCS